jgi:hypothetical protein
MSIPHGHDDHVCRYCGSAIHGQAVTFARPGGALLEPARGPDAFHVECALVLNGLERLRHEAVHQ